MEEKKNLVRRVLAWPVTVRNYIQELQLEMRRVTWPTWKQVRATTGVVIACVFAFAAYFYVVDLMLGRAVTKIFDAFSK